MSNTETIPAIWWYTYILATWRDSWNTYWQLEQIYEIYIRNLKRLVEKLLGLRLQQQVEGCLSCWNVRPMCESNSKEKIMSTLILKIMVIYHLLLLHVNSCFQFDFMLWPQNTPEQDPAVLWTRHKLISSVWKRNVENLTASRITYFGFCSKQNHLISVTVKDGGKYAGGVIYKPLVLIQPTDGALSQTA